MSTTTTYTGVRIVDMPDLGAMNAASSVVGERAGSGRFSAAALKSFIQSDVANVCDYGARGDGVTDDTVAIQAAVNTGMPVVLPAGDYVISSEITVSTTGQAIRGAGRQATFISILGPNAGFNTAVFAVTNTSGGSDSCQYFSDFTLSMAQPDTNVRANLNAYPPAFYLYYAGRCQFMNVRICGGMDGIFMFGNCGGFRAYGLDFGNFGRNIYIDGNLDITAFTDCEVWCFSKKGIMTANQQQIFWDANCYGIVSNRNDYLSWTGGLFMVGRAAVFGTGTRSDYPGTTYGWFTGTGFDTYGGLEVDAGNILTDNCVFSPGGDPVRSNNAVRHTGGVVTVRGAKFFCGPDLPNQTVVYSSAPSGAAALTVEDCNFDTGPIDVRSIYVGAGNDYLSAIVTGNQFNRLSGYTFTTAIIELAGGNGVIGNNVVLDPVGGSIAGAPPWLGIDAGAGPYMVRGNMANAWATTVVSNVIASANSITLPAVVGDAMPEVIITGNTSIGAMTYAKNIGTNSAYGGLTVTLVFSATITILNGTVGTAGQFILNGRTNFGANANSSLTVQLTTQGNWQEIGRCL